MNYRNRIRNRITVGIAMLLATLSYNSQAATVSYVLDQSNALPDNIDYLTVTISDGVEGQLDFWVDIQPALTDIAGENFGIQKFAFNVTGDLLSGMPIRHDWKGEEFPGNETAREHRENASGEAHNWGGERRHDEGQHCALDTLLTAESFILPDGWDVRLDKGGHHGEDGFNVRLLGNGNNRQDPLHFTVLGLALEDVLAGFSAHVAGFEFISGECGEGEGGHEGGHLEGCKRITSAYFYGDRAVVVPLPATVWLLGSGLLGMVGFARRRERQA